MKYNYVGVLFVFLLLTHTNAKAETVDPKNVMTLLRNGQSKLALDKYFNCAGHNNAGYKYVSSGSKIWISVAEEALKHSDACYTDGILSSLGQAMQVSPVNVLPLVGKSDILSPDDICISSISSGSPTKKQQLLTLSRFSKAIMRVKDKHLLKQKNKCLSIIEKEKISILAESGN